MKHMLKPLSWKCRCAVLVAALVLLAAPAAAQFPIGEICKGLEDLCQPPRSACSASGFKITLTAFSPANPSDGGVASYTYTICSPPAGVCTGTVRLGEPCLEHNFCRRKGTRVDQTATCTRECATDEFRNLSHFDVVFPAIGASCISEGTVVTGSCSVGDFVGDFVLGDAACFGAQGGSQNFVAKCDNTPTLQPGECLTMTVNIPSEEVGLAAAVVVDKAGPNCTGTCIAGPSCEKCGTPPEPGGCLTRTAGFWGTHPHVTAQFLPVTVCGVSLGTTLAGSPTSATEALCVAGGVECKSNTAYVQLVRQLAAAKLNLAATAANGGTCGDAISALITKCESLCTADQKTISASGCIQLLDAFNNSVDTLTPTPAPFNNPGPADPTQCQTANGNGIVIGKSNFCK
jgi:hypothetical protein